MTFDVVIVGARCAGAALAVALRRAGLSVVLLEATRLPSDQGMSTHLIHPPGMDELDALGIGDRVRALAPRLDACRFDFDGRMLLLRYGEGRAARCLRRAKLDAILQSEAASAGADLRSGARVISVVRSATGRVTGVDVRYARGGVERITARLVVGADGRSSTIARLVDAKEYLSYDGPRAAYWAYWRRPAEWDPHVFYSGFHADESHVLFPTDDDLVVVATSPPVARVASYRTSVREAYGADVRAFPPFAGLGEQPVGPVRGIVKPRYFFRTAAGAGWALAGDAGHHKEFAIGIGISDALRDARALAAAIVANDDAALMRYWRRRDVDRIEMFRWGQEIGRADRVSALERLVAERAAALPQAANRFGDVIDGRCSPYDLFPASRVAAWVLGAALRGDVGPVPDFARAVARGVRARLERRRFARLLAASTRGRVTSAPPGRRVPTPALRGGCRSVGRGTARSNTVRAGLC